MLPKKKNDKDEAGKVLLNLMFLPVYNLVQKVVLSPCGAAYVSLRDAHLILSRNETKRNTAYIDDLILA
jgi:hypothetical protein